MSAEATTVAAGTTTLAATVAGAGPAVTLVHGFAQNRDCLGPIAQALAEQHRVLRPDAPGHGASLRHATASVGDAAQLLVATAGAGTYVGYSMGGRICLQAAVEHPDAVRALVLISATAGIEDPGEREQRRLADAALAERLERIGLDAFVEEWLSLPMFSGLPQWARFDRERRSNSAEGLAASLRCAGTGVMEPLWDRLGRLAIPVLCISGASDERYGALAERMIGLIGAAAHHVSIPGAGHAAHLERPDAVIEAVAAFLGGSGH